MPPSVLPKLNLGFLLALGLQFAVSILAYLNLTRLGETAALREQSHQILATLSELLAQLIDAETGQRGFLLTGREEYLQPYRRALPAADSQMEQLRYVEAIRRLGLFLQVVQVPREDAAWRG